MSDDNEIRVFNIKSYANETFAGSVHYLCITSRLLYTTMWKNNHTISAVPGGILELETFVNWSMDFVWVLLASMCVCVSAFVRACSTVLMRVRACLFAFLCVRVFVCVHASDCMRVYASLCVLCMFAYLRMCN